MQEMAAHELYKHNWRYHKDLKLWLTKEAGTEPVQKTATFERGSYMYVHRSPSQGVQCTDCEGDNRRTASSILCYGNEYEEISSYNSIR